MFMCPLSPAGATVRPRPSRRPGSQPPSEWGRVLPLLRRRVEAEYPRDGGPEARSPRASGLKACSPRAGLVGSPSEESPGVLQDVSL
jgi:hypothetical protein